MRGAASSGQLENARNIHSNEVLLNALIDGLKECRNDYVVGVPNPYLHQTRALLENTAIGRGQNVKSA